MSLWWVGKDLGPPCRILISTTTVCFIFLSATLPTSDFCSFGAAWGDVNDDGFLDLLTCSKLYINQGNANKWLKVRLLGDGTTVNRAAIGTQVRIALHGQVPCSHQVRHSTA